MQNGIYETKEGAFGYRIERNKDESGMPWITIKQEEPEEGDSAGNIGRNRGLGICLLHWVRKRMDSQKKNKTWQQDFYGMP